MSRISVLGCRTLAACLTPAALGNDAPARPLPARQRRRQRRRPTIISVMTDDQGYGDLAARGNRIIETPNFDRLRDQSGRLTEFHVSPPALPRGRRC